MSIDFKTFLSIVNHITDARYPVLLRGRHGIGKSTVVYQYAKNAGLPIVERRASQMTEGDLLGLPDLADAYNQKITKFLEYPSILDMKDYNINYSNKKGGKYALQSMAIHDGSLGGGHYYAVCKNYLEDKWYEYNDTRVNRITDEKSLNYSPYLFVYKRL